MHILLFYIPVFIMINCCFYGIMREKYNKYYLERITDNLVEIDNSGNTSDSITAICLADNTTDIYELNNNNRDNNRDNNNNIDNSNNSNNRVVPLIPLDNIIIQE